MIKAIIFDLGGVVLKHSYEFTTTLMGKPFKVKEPVVRELFLKIKSDWTLGKITVKDVASKFNEILNTPKPIGEIVETWQKQHEKTVEYNKKVLLLIRRLKRNYQLILLSNTLDLHFEAIEKKGLNKYFDKIYTSYTLGFIKPDIKFFNLVLKENNLKPYEAIFIDDLKENVDAAKSIGINGIQFKEPKQLLSQLIKFEVEI